MSNFTVKNILQWLRMLWSRIRYKFTKIPRLQRKTTEMLLMKKTTLITWYLLMELPKKNDERIQIVALQSNTENTFKRSMISFIHVHTHTVNYVNTNRWKEWSMKPVNNLKEARPYINKDNIRLYNLNLAKNWKILNSFVVISNEIHHSMSILPQLLCIHWLQPTTLPICINQPWQKTMSAITDIHVKSKNYHTN